MRHLRWLAVGLSLMASPALAGSQTSIGYTPGSGVNVSGFTCFSTLFCAGHVLIDNTGAEKGTSGNPVFVQPNGSGTQPISGSINPSGGPVLATATTADPSYSNGTSNALSTNLAGYMRIIAPASQLLARMGARRLALTLGRALWRCARTARVRQLAPRRRSRCNAMERGSW